MRRRLDQRCAPNRRSLLSDTGASTITTPGSARGQLVTGAERLRDADRARLRALAALGEAPATPSPKITEFAAAVAGSKVITTCAPVTASAAEDASAPPASATELVTAADRSRGRPVVLVHGYPLSSTWVLSAMRLPTALPRLPAG